MVAKPGASHAGDPSPRFGDFTGTDRFQLLRGLGYGGSGVVFEALDRERDARVAIKVLAHRDADSLVRFKQEFRALQGLHHPNLVERGELFAEGDHWFFTMELVEGVDLLSHVRGLGRLALDAAPPGARDVTLVDEETGAAPRPTTEGDGGVGLAPPAREERLRPVLRQLAAGLAALHAAGKVHRDIKPANVLVTDAGRVVILDGGLVADLAGGDPRRQGGISGTVTFMAPEQTQGAPVTDAADWYSVGVILYCALAGRPPLSFRGSYLEVLKAKLSGPPPAPFTLHGEAVPADLERLCLSLLHPDPRRRPSGAEIVALLGAGGPSVVPASTIPAPSFVGRRRELAELEALALQASQGQPSAVLIQGESGIGKSTLLQRLVAEIALRWPEALVLRGRCYEREAVPFKAFDGIMEGIADELAALSPAERAAALPEGAELLGLAFPVLHSLVAGAAVAPAPGNVEPHELRRRLFQATRALLAEMAKRHFTILLIDDVHWADADSLALLAEILRPPGNPPLFVAATARFGPLALLPADAQRIVLSGLSEGEARELAASLVWGARAAEVAPAIAADSGGHPLFIQELARLSGGTAPVPRTLEAALGARLSRLDPAARRMLEVLAVATSPLPPLAAARAAEVDPSQLHAPLALLRTERLARMATATTSTTGSGGPIEPYHDRVRQAVLVGLEASVRQQRHASLAEALASLPGADPEALAVHFGEAGERDKARRYAVLAAEQACQALAFERAVRMFRQALAVTDEAGPARTLRLQLAESLANAGRGMEAAEEYRQARTGADPEEALELGRRAAHHLLQSGRIDEGLAAISEVLRDLDLGLPRTPTRALMELLWHRAKLRLRGTQFASRPEAEVAPGVLQRIDATWSVAIGLAMVDNIRSAVFQARNLHLALSAGEPLRVLRALSMEATLLAATGPGGARRARRLIVQAEGLAAGLDQPAAAGFARLCAGAVAFLGAQWGRARELCLEAEHILRERCTGVSYEVTQAQLFATWSNFFLGRMADVIQNGPLLQSRAEDRGDLFAVVSQSSGLANLAWLAQDDPREARRQVEQAEQRWAKRSYQFQHYWHLLAHTQIDLYVGDGAAAHVRVESSWRELSSTLLLRIQNMRIEAQGLRGRAALAAATHTDGPQAERLLRAAAGHARRVARERTDWAAGISALLFAGVAARRGQRELAASELATAAAAFTAGEMELHALCAREALARLRGGPEAASHVREAHAILTRQGVARPDRLFAMLAPGT